MAASTSPAGAVGRKRPLARSAGLARRGQLAEPSGAKLEVIHLTEAVDAERLTEA